MENTPPIPPTLGDALLDRFELIAGDEFESVVSTGSYDPKIQFLRYKNDNEKSKLFCSFGVSKIKYRGSKSWEMWADVEVADVDDLEEIPVLMCYLIERILDVPIFPARGITMPLPDDFPFFKKYQKKHVHIGSPGTLSDDEYLVTWKDETVFLVMMTLITEDEYAFGEANSVEALVNKFVEGDIKARDLSRHSCL